MKVYIFYPSWNLTALVDFKPQNDEEKYSIEQKIFSQNAHIEQVGFIYQEDWVYKLEMSHNELCVNAVFSYLCYLDLHEDIAHTEIYLVWPDFWILGKKSDSQLEYIIEFPAIRKHQIVQLHESTRIELPGISHIFFEWAEKDFDTFLTTTISQLKNVSSDIVTGIHCIKHSEELEDQLKPYIYYHRTGTVVLETSCSSWSIALVARNIFSIWEEWMRVLRIWQISGEALKIETNFSDGSLHCSIKNTVKTVKEMEITQEMY